MFQCLLHEPDDSSICWFDTKVHDSSLSWLGTKVHDSSLSWLDTKVQHSKKFKDMHDILIGGNLNEDLNK
jgi:hypothetical protein